MLSPITKKYTDDSSMKQFKFTFYCDCCGKPIFTKVYDFNSAFAQKTFLSNDEKEARAIIYANEHREAYERANNEVRLNLNRCEICGDMICEDCSVYSDKLGGGVCCKKCGEANNEAKVSDYVYLQHERR
ncbi:MAG: hypothetical protein IJW06_05460 [Clostridia bacterium]|nr:hypothetical protein [Clostridia bacterium]